jgi:hypothetical protein
VSQHNADSIRLKVSRKQREERLDPSKLSSEYVCHANDVITLKLIRLSSELMHEFGSFHPSFTHQLFVDEEIVGYKKLSVQIYFTAGSLYTLLMLDFDDKIGQGSDDVYQQIAGKLAPGFTTDVREFKKVCSQSQQQSEIDCDPVLSLPGVHAAVVSAVLSASCLFSTSVKSSVLQVRKFSVTSSPAWIHPRTQ